MTFYYKLPQDLYCWGQDRGGTLIPLISQIFHKFLKISAVNSVSLSNYLILILGFIGFSSLFKNKFTKLLFAIIWFFPPIRFIDLTRFPLGMQYSLIGFSIFLINKINFTNKKLLFNHILLFLVIFILSISIWVSDLAIVSIIILGGILLVYQYLEKNKPKINKIVLSYTLLGAIGNYFFIKYAKSYATTVNSNYIAINDLHILFQEIKILLNELFEVLTFQNEEFLFSIYAWFVLICIVFCILFITKISLNLDLKKWFTFFIVDFIVIFGVILLSKWFYLNGMGRWYFIASYISFSMIILMIFDNLKLDYYKNLIIKLALFSTVIIGAFSTIHYLKFIRPKTLRSRIDVRSEFLKLGKIGIIGNFWNSYITACPDPAKIKATPHDSTGVRNQDLVDDVFSQPKLYVIKDMWLDTFPDTLRQFGYLLVKSGDSFRLGDCDVNRYIKIKRNETIPFKDLKFRQDVRITDKGIEVYKDSTQLKNNFVIWGPYYPIGIGDFVVEYEITINNIEKDKPIAMFDVVADYGKTKLVQKELITENSDNKITENFSLEFKTTKRYTNIEFRTYFYGNSDLIIKNIRLIEK
jgi:hypothetical protein